MQVTQTLRRPSSRTGSLSSSLRAMRMGCEMSTMMMPSRATGSGRRDERNRASRSGSRSRV